MAEKEIVWYLFLAK